MAKDRTELHDAQSRLNSAKNDMIEELDRLMELGFMREAATLEKIIIKLEVWQNSYR